MMITPEYQDKESMSKDIEIMLQKLEKATDKKEANSDQFVIYDIF